MKDLAIYVYSMILLGARTYLAPFPLLHVLLGVIQSVDRTYRFNLNDAPEDFARLRNQEVIIFNN